MMANHDEIVAFNVGGVAFATLRSTISKKIVKLGSSTEHYDPNLLQEIVNKTCPVKLDRVGAVFVDRSPKYFDFILGYLRCANTNEIFSIEDVDLEHVYNEALFYKLDGLLDLIEQSQGFESAILSKEQRRELLALCDLPLRSRLRLLYRGSRDGFGGEQFHFRCDDRAKTLCIVQSHNGFIFGGYAEQTWSGNGYKSDPNAFIFSLINGENRPIKMMSRNSSSIYCSPLCSVAFGKGHDFCISSNENNNNFSYLGPTYRHPQHESGSQEAHSFLAGTYNFSLNEIEVFQLI